MNVQFIQPRYQNDYYTHYVRRSSKRQPLVTRPLSLLTPSPILNRTTCVSRNRSDLFPFYVLIHTSHPTIDLIEEHGRLAAINDMLGPLVRGFPRRFDVSIVSVVDELEHVGYNLHGMLDTACDVAKGLMGAEDREYVW